jgi:hypothetical protein
MKRQYWNIDWTLLDRTTGPPVSGKPYERTRPPSTRIMAPVTKDDSSEQSHSTSEVTSRGSPTLPIGCLPIIALGRRLVPQQRPFRQGRPDETRADDVDPVTIFCSNRLPMLVSRQSFLFQMDSFRNYLFTYLLNHPTHLPQASLAASAR